MPPITEPHDGKVELVQSPIENPTLALVSEAEIDGTGTFASGNDAAPFAAAENETPANVALGLAVHVVAWIGMAIDQGAVPAPLAEMQTPVDDGFDAYCAAPPAQQVGDGLRTETPGFPVKVNETAGGVTAITKDYEGIA